MTGCLDMSFHENERAMLRAPCPNGFVHYSSSISNECPEGRTCELDADGNLCIDRILDSSGGGGKNCPAGWITVSSSEAGNCKMLEDQTDIDNVDTLEDLGTDQYYCREGSVQGHYCRYVPPENSDSLIVVLNGQRCTDQEANPPSNSLRVHVIDVGQGDAIWIQTPTGQNVLVDGGEGLALKTLAAPVILDYLEFHDFPKGSTFDAVFLSHPHSDHYGGFPTIFKSYKLANYIDPMDINTTEDVPAGYQSWVKQVQGMIASDHIYMPAETKFAANPVMPDDFFGSEVKAEYVFSRKQYASDDPNTASTIFRITYKGKSFIFTGDATNADESAAIKKGADKLQSNFLKVCHHGSTTSSSKAFLDAIWNGIEKTERGAFISSGRTKFSGTYIPAESTVSRLLGYVDQDNLFSTSAGDESKEESETFRDDNILIVVKPDGSHYACYSGTN